MKTGREPFNSNGKELDRTLLDFWRWSSSDILNNALRGVLAEYIVALDLDCEKGIRKEWDAYDLLTPGGVKVEVKSASYLQSWEQEKHSVISFGIRPTYGWDAETNTQSTKLQRQADVYVFCLLAHKEKASVDPLNLDQWEFYVLSSSKLDKAVGGQKTISLSALDRLRPAHCRFGGLQDAVAGALNDPNVE